MHIIESEYKGFCYGVENAIKILNEALRKYKNVSLSHKICHNRCVEKKLKIPTFDENSCPDAVVISAHGASQSFIDKVKKKGIEIVDATCPVVRNKIETVKKIDGVLAFVGLKGHAETISTTSSLSCSVHIISSLIEAKKFIKNNRDITSAYIAVQSSFSEEIYNDAKNYLSTKINITQIGGGICMECLRRRQDAQRLSLCSKSVLIVGDEISTNARELLNIAQKNCPSYLVSDDNFKYENLVEPIGVISSSSSSYETYSSVVERLKSV